MVLRVILRVIFAVLIIGGLVIYRKNAFKVINFEKKNSESKVISLGYDKLSNLIMVFLCFDLLTSVMSSQGYTLAKNILRLGTLIFTVGMIIYCTKIKVKNTVIIRKDDLILFINGEEEVGFDKVNDVSIEVTENPYVYLITLSLIDGKEYKITGRDQYEMNKTIRLINEKINKNILGVKGLASA